MITASVARALPVVIPPHIVPALVSGRVRALVRPPGEMGPLRPGYALWVREAVTVADRQRRKDALDLNYAGEQKPVSVPWVAALAKPGAGHRPAEGMPVQASRFTLLIDRVEHLRLSQVDEAAAVAAGVEPEGDGYAALGYPFMRPLETHTEALGFQLYCDCGVRADNPEVILIHFRAVSRNISRLLINDR